MSPLKETSSPIHYDVTVHLNSGSRLFFKDLTPDRFLSLTDGIRGLRARTNEDVFLFAYAANTFYIKPSSVEYYAVKENNTKDVDKK